MVRVPARALTGVALATLLGCTVDLHGSQLEGPSIGNDASTGPLDEGASDTGDLETAIDADEAGPLGDEDTGAPPDGAPLEDGDVPLADGAPDGVAEDADASTSDGGEAAEAESGPNLPIDLDLVVASDADDAEWMNGTDERLHYSDSDRAIEVGADSEMGRMALRFTLPLPKGSTIMGAQIRMHRTDSGAASTETIQIQVFDTVNVPL